MISWATSWRPHAPALICCGSSKSCQAGKLKCSNTHLASHAAHRASLAAHCHGTCQHTYTHCACVGAATEPLRRPGFCTMMHDVCGSNCLRTGIHAHCALVLTLMQQDSSSSLATCTLLQPLAATEHSAGMTGILAPIQAGRPSLALVLLSLLPLLLLSDFDSSRNRSPLSGSNANHSLLRQRQQCSTAHSAAAVISAPF